MADVVLVDGWFPGPDRLRDPVWRGPLAEFLCDNNFYPGEEDELRADIERDRFHQMGGGAAPEFTVYEAGAYAELVAMVVESEG